MKRRLTFLIAISVIAVLAISVFCACDKTQKLDREMDTEIVGIYQDFSGNLLVELKNFKHSDYEGGYAQDETAMEFSLDGGKTWMIWSASTEDWCKDKGIYYVMYPTRDGNYDITGFEASSYDGTKTTFKTGDSASVCVRIPESSKYKASEFITSDSIKLKDQALETLVDMSEINVNGFRIMQKGYIEGFLPWSAGYEEVGTYFPYNDGESVKFGIISQIEEKDGDRKITALKYYEELSGVEKQGLSKFEYRIIKPDNYYDIIDDPDGSFVFEGERYDSFTAKWTSLNSNGIAFSSVAQPENIWEYKRLTGTSSFEDTETGEIFDVQYNYSTYSSVFILLRVKADDDKVASYPIALEIVLDEQESVETE